MTIITHLYLRLVLINFFLVLFALPPVLLHLFLVIFNLLLQGLKLLYNVVNSNLDFSISSDFPPFPRGVSPGESAGGSSMVGNKENDNPQQTMSCK
jgi:hypothetical protein